MITLLPATPACSRADPIFEMPSAPQRIRALAIELGLDEPESVLRARSAQAIGIAPEAVRGLRLARRSLDARKRSGASGNRRELRFIVHVDLDLEPEFRSASLDRALTSGRAKRVGPPARFELEVFDEAWRGRRVVVVGTGPAGLYAAWTLASHAVAVDLIDRGPELRERGRAVARFTRTRELDPERNLLFGEGGAGTYSDGKLYTRTEHALEAPIVQTLIEAGAEPEIGFDARAHIGTDRLHRILPRLRARLERFKDDPSVVMAIGIEHAIRQCRRLLEAGAPGVHFYTLTQSHATRSILAASKAL